MLLRLGLGATASSQNNAHPCRTMARQSTPLERAKWRPRVLVSVLVERRGDAPRGGGGARSERAKSDDGSGDGVLARHLGRAAAEARGDARGEHDGERAGQVAEDGGGDVVWESRARRAVDVVNERRKRDESEQQHDAEAVRGDGAVDGAEPRVAGELARHGGPQLRPTDVKRNNRRGDGATQHKGDGQGRGEERARGQSERG
mmetsp:Transcript_3962/g.12213  ORF Transcript_3962/g.12213 Transcript_3962/m.12213 type:complete len:203 (+) Transcript_3962:76-684(+)